jgi:hypothetical protein
VEKRPTTIDIQTVLVVFFAAVALVLGLRFLRQYISLMFSLLTLKFVWFILILLAVLTLMKKRT